MSNTNWRQYQEATARLFRNLGCEAEVEFRAQGVRGRHKVDVYVQYSHSGIQCTWIVECKLWSSRISKEKVMALKSIVDDLGADRGFIFCERGFQSGAEKAARGTNITLVTSIRDFAHAAMGLPSSTSAHANFPSIFQTFAEELDDVAEEQISVSTEMAPAEIRQIITARSGQGLFRANVLKLEPFCRLTGIANPRFLRVAHLKPWRVCAGAERLDGHNGLAFTPNADLLFDEGLISFENDGELLVSRFVTNDEMNRLGLSRQHHLTYRPFRPQQRKYLDYHRSSVFRAG